jgi:sulfite reductase (ferredoxin)
VSDVEDIKRESRHLRGTIAESLADGGTSFGESDQQLIKYHGIYQQEDRDARTERKKAGLEPSYAFMLRSRVPGGVLNARQYLVHDELAGSVSNGSLRLTTRQAFQLHGVLKGDLKTAIKRISDSLLTTIAACGDVNRNVMSCPAPPSTQSECDVAQLAHRLAEHFTPKTRAYAEIWIDGERADAPDIAEEDVEPIYGKTYLPRKFKMGVALPPDNCVDIFTQDIGFVAIVRDEKLVGYTMLVGGGMGMTHGKTTTYPRVGTPLCFVTPSEAIEVAEAVLTTQRDFGDRTNRKHARLKYLVEDRGIAWIRSEVERRVGRAIALPVEFHFERLDDHLGWREQSTGAFALGLLVENGRVKDTEHAKLRSALRAVITEFAPPLRLTGQQNILLLDIAAEDRPRIEARFAQFGVNTDPAASGVHRHAMACPALPTCGLALTDAERALPAVVDDIVEILESVGLDDERLSIRMTGCPNGCARPYMGDVGFVGRSKDLYDIFLGGDFANTRLNWLYMSSVRRDQLARELQPLLLAWSRERIDAEGFGDYCSRTSERIRSLAQAR